MKVSLEWLREYVDAGAPGALADALTMSGIEVEAVEATKDGDTVFEVEITPNRPDCLSHWGVARDLSALTGEKVMPLLDRIDRVFDQFSRRIGTPVINRAVREMIERHPPPWAGKGRLKFYYATQTRTRPPTFVLFMNRPEMLHFSYERFLANQFRSHFDLDAVPVRLLTGAARPGRRHRHTCRR